MRSWILVLSNLKFWFLVLLIENFVLLVCHIKILFAWWYIESFGLLCGNWLFALKDGHFAPAMLNLKMMVLFEFKLKSELKMLVLAMNRVEFVDSWFYHVNLIIVGFNLWNAKCLFLFHLDWLIFVPISCLEFALFHFQKNVSSFCFILIHVIGAEMPNPLLLRSDRC